MSSYNKTIKELFDLQKYAIKLGLDNITKLCISLNNPHLIYNTIHVAGTNGKGSTAIILQRILMEHGLKTGLFTSPHLIDFRERIRVNDSLIEDKFITNFWREIKDQVLNLKATFFDTTTCMAFEYFKQRKVDVAIFETGLGGRLDSTNIIQPTATIITPVNFDHQKQLGNSLLEIASEKAGIIKKNSEVFLGRQKKDVLKYFKNTQFHNNKIHFLKKTISDLNANFDKDKTEFSFIDKQRKEQFKKLSLNLLGIHQAENACLAYLAGRWFLDQGNIVFKRNKFRSALSKVQWPGRIQKISSSPDIYFDVSHNVDGFKKTMKVVSPIFNRKKTKLLIGLLEDKNYQEIVKTVINKFSCYTITEPENQRYMKAETIKLIFTEYGIDVNIIKDVSKAFEMSINDLNKDETLLIIGSHFLAKSVFETIGKIT